MTAKFTRFISCQNYSKIFFIQCFLLFWHLQSLHYILVWFLSCIHPRRSFDNTTWYLLQLANIWFENVLDLIQVGQIGLTWSVINLLSTDNFSPHMLFEAMLCAYLRIVSNLSCNTFDYHVLPGKTMLFSLRNVFTHRRSIERLNSPDSSKFNFCFRNFRPHSLLILLQIHVLSLFSAILRL